MRVSDALRALAGKEESRAIVPVTYPNFPAGQTQMQLVRTADPSEYRRDGKTIRIQGFNAHPVVHACIRVIADIVASVPLVVLKEKGNAQSRVPESHPLQQLLDYPGPRFTARQFRLQFAVNFLGYGNAFFEIERQGLRGKPRGLRGVNPESLQQVWIDPEGDPRRYDYANWAGIIVNVPVENMLHFKDMEMSRPFEADVFGFPRGATAIGSILADNEATQYVRQVVTNDGTPTFAVLMADEASTEDAVAMQDRYTARVVSRGKRGVPAFFGAVKDIKPLGFTLSDLEFPDLRRVAREDICAAFGVDPRMIGIASASSDAGLSGIQYAEARARLVQHTIEPMFSAFEDELNHWLAPEFGDVWVTYDHDMLRDLVENDTETSMRVRAEYSEGLRTWEESRRAIKLSPLPEPTDSILKVAGRDMIPAALAVIDPSTILDEPPATDNETPDMAPNAINALPPSSNGLGSDVQGTALNGAQVTSLVSMLTQLAAGQLPDDTVEALIKAAFPAVSDDLVAQMLAGMKGFTPTTPIEVAPVRRVSRLSVRAFAEDALNGEQVEALMELLEELIDKKLPRETVEALIQAAFPKMDRDLISAMLDGIDGFEPPDDEPEGGLPEASEGEASARMMPEERTALRRAYWERAMQELDRTEMQYKATAKAQFAREKKRVTNAIASAGTVAIAESRVRQMYRTNGEFEDDWRVAFEPLVSKTYESGAKQVAGTGASIPAALNDKTIRAEVDLPMTASKKQAADAAKKLAAPQLKANALAAIKARTVRLSELIGDTTAKEVLAAIRAGEQGALSVAEISRLVGRAVYGEERVDARTNAIARTEAAGAMSQGSWDQAQAEGELFRSKTWLSFDDKDTRDTHRALNETTIDINDPFITLTGDVLMYPLDPGADAGEVINCRCVLAYSDEPV